MNKGDLVMATHLFDELIRLPRLPTTNEEPPKIFYNYALLLIKQGRLDDAEVVLKQTITAHPSYASAQHELALLLASRGRHDEAIVTLSKALSLELPSAKRGKYAFNLASIHAESGDLRSAEQHLIDACKADPTETSYTSALTAVRRRLSDMASSDERPPIVTSDSRETP
jgi:tetratricopeptide (TPR) repeat protein